MLYQLSYASPAQTEQNYHRGNSIASSKLAVQQNLCQYTTYFCGIPNAHVLLCSGLRELPVLERNVVLDLAQRNGQRRPSRSLTQRKRQLHSIHVAKILEILNEFRCAVRAVMLAHNADRQGR